MFQHVPTASTAQNQGPKGAEWPSWPCREPKQEPNGPSAAEVNAEVSNNLSEKIKIVAWPARKSSISSTIQQSQGEHCYIAAANVSDISSFFGCVAVVDVRSTRKTNSQQPFLQKNTSRHALMFD